MEDSRHRSHGKDYGGETTNPFDHELVMSRKDWMRTYLFGIFILPIRVVLAWTLLIIWSIVARIGLLNLKERDITNKPIVSWANWRKVIKTVCETLSRAIARSFGLSVTIKGKIAPAEEAPICIIAPHSSRFDNFLALGFIGNASFVAGRRKLESKICRPVNHLNQNIFVDQGNSCSSSNAKCEIVRRCNLHKHPNLDERWPRIGVMREGQYTNRRVLMRFKTGAFKPGKPVQPILIRYHKNTDIVTHDYDNSMRAIWVTLCQPITRVELEYLPVYHPNLDEQKDAELFASNVRTMISKKLTLPLCEMTFKEAFPLRKKYT